MTFSSSLYVCYPSSSCYFCYLVSLLLRLRLLLALLIDCLLIYVLLLVHHHHHHHYHFRISSFHHQLIADIPLFSLLSFFGLMFFGFLFFFIVCLVSSSGSSSRTLVGESKPHKARKLRRITMERKR